MALNPTTLEEKRDERIAYTPIGVLCFADSLYKPRAPAPNAKERYSCILLFDKRGVASQAYQELRRAVAAAITAEWGAAKAADTTFVRSLRLPFRQAADKQYAGFEDGEIYINPWKSAEQDPPGVVNIRGIDMMPKDVWSGQLARATVRAFAYDQSGNKGVAFGLEHVQVIKADAPRIDGRRTASEAFKGADVSELLALGIDPNATTTTAESADLPF